MSISLSHKELESLRKLRHAVSECENEDEIRSVSLQLLEEVMQTEASNFYITIQQECGWKVDDFVSRGLSDAKHDEYLQHFVQMDPFQKLGPHPNQVLIAERIIDWEKHLAGEYYNDFLKPQGIHHMMNSWLHITDDIHSVMAFFRPASKAPFSPREQILCELTAPPIIAALQKTLVENYKREEALEKIKDSLRWNYQDHLV